MWDLGMIIWTVIALILIIGCTITAQLCYAQDRSEHTAWASSMISGAKLIARICNGVAITVLIILVISWFPYQKEYFYWEPTGGEVAAIESRMMADGDGMTENFVVTFIDGGQQYRCDDTRCALVKPGDTLLLNCKRSWQWASTHGYTCRFDGHEPATGDEP